MIDLHCHVLPGIDDGPKTAEGSLEIARAAAAAGVSTLLATPHVSSHYRNDAATIAAELERLAARLRAERVALELRGGAEVAVTVVERLDDGELTRLRLGGGCWLLVEPPFSPVAPPLAPILAGLRERGHGVLIAHPERCPSFHRNPRLLGELVRGGALTSITAGSLVGRFGGRARSFALRLVHEELAHNVASDAHDARSRAPGMLAEIERAGLGALAPWLTEEVPSAILDGGPIPPRPSIAAPGRRGLRLRARRR